MGNGGGLVRVRMGWMEYVGGRMDTYNVVTACVGVNRDEQTRSYASDFDHQW